MLLRNCDIRTFFERSEKKGIVCIGVGEAFYRFIKMYEEYPWSDRVVALLDNSPGKCGHEVNVYGKKFLVKKANEFIKNCPSNIMVLITCSFFEEIIDQLNEETNLDNIEVYIYSFIKMRYVHELVPIKKTGPFLIPPVIHYCWFGRNEMPELYQNCIASWRKYCPNYEIVEWNEDTCDFDSNSFAREAYEAGKYGFVSDWFHLKIIYEYGGIYLDTDVELLKSLDDLRREEAFCGMQTPGVANLGLGFGAVKGHKVISRMMERYKNLHFDSSDEKAISSCVSPLLQTQDLKELGMKNENKWQQVEGMTIFPVEVLSPKSLVTEELDITEYSYSIHHYSGSWVSKKAKMEREKYIASVRRILERMEEG